MRGSSQAIEFNWICLAPRLNHHHHQLTPIVRQREKLPLRSNYPYVVATSSRRCRDVVSTSSRRRRDDVATSRRRRGSLTVGVGFGASDVWHLGSRCGLDCMVSVSALWPLDCLASGLRYRRFHNYVYSKLRFSFRFRFVPFFSEIFLKFQISIGQGWGGRHGRTERHGRAPALAN